MEAHLYGVSFSITMNYDFDNQTISTEVGSFLREKFYQVALVEILKGMNEPVETEVPMYMEGNLIGRADIVTDKKIIELKICLDDTWKDAMGQILVYSHCDGVHFKQLELVFCTVSEKYKNPEVFKQVETICGRYNIQVRTLHEQVTTMNVSFILPDKIVL